MSVITQVPEQETTAPQPVLSPEVCALLVTAGCTVKWNGFVFTMKRKGKSYALGSIMNTAPFEDWQASVKAVVEATG